MRSSKGWQIGRVAGVPVIVAQSWLLIAALVTFLFGTQLSSGRPDLGVLAYAVSFGYAIALFLTVLVHEIAHALAARAVGLPSTHIMITFWGGHTQFETETRSPGTSVIVAIVGPLANAALAVVVWFASLMATPGGIPERLLFALFLTNVLLAAFNSLPGLPLDGGRVLEAVVWKVSGSRTTGTVAAGWAGRVVAVLAFGWAFLPLLDGGRPSLITIVWVALIASMLWNAAGQAIRSAGLRRRAEQVDLRTLMQPVTAVPVGTSLDRLDVLARQQQIGAVVVTDASGAVRGLVDPSAAGAVPLERRSLVSVESVYRGYDPAAVLPVTLVGDDLIRALQQASSQHAVVVDHHRRPVGLVDVNTVTARLIGTTRP